MLNDLIEMLLPAGPKRKARRLLEHGEVVVGRIDAIRVIERGESLDFWEYGVQAAGTRFGLRQWLEPGRGFAEPRHGGRPATRRGPHAHRLARDLRTARAAHLSHSVGGWKALSEPPRPASRA